jgi:ribonuclease III
MVALGLPRGLEHLPDPDLAADDGTDPPAWGDRDRLMDALGWRFRRPALLRVATTVASWVHEHPRAGWPSNACLEFFGDAVLDLLTADALWQRFPALAEGDLTRLRAHLVSEGGLLRAAQALDLGAYLWMGRGDLKHGGRSNEGILADAVESVLGAVFLDARADGQAPLEAVERVFMRLFERQLDGLDPEATLDAKSRLQQWAQGRFRLTPVYARIGEAPHPDAPHWRVRVELRRADGSVEVLGEGDGRSLKLAERAAARAALDRVDTAEG